MNNTKLPCSINNTRILRKLILENPSLPILIFCGEEAWSGEYQYEQTETRKIIIRELILFNDYWLEKDDYRTQLEENLNCEKEYESLSEEEFDQMIQKKVEETEFVKAIVIYVG